MNTKQKILSHTVIAVCGTSSSLLHAALPVDPVLNFTPTFCSYSTPCQQNGGSWFAMDLNGNSKLVDTERTAISTFQGLRIRSLSSSTARNNDTTQTATGSHGGPVNGLESPGIDNAWAFQGSTGMHLTTSTAAVINETGSSATINFDDWSVIWNQTPQGNTPAPIDMGTGAWNPLSGAPSGSYSNGIAQLTCETNCSEGETFQLNYAATVPAGDPSGFGGIRYFLHLEGTIGTYNDAPVTTDINTGVLSTNGGGTSEEISLTDAVTDSTDTLSNDNDYSSSTATISNASANIATNCTPTSVTANNDGTVTFPACPNGTYTFDFSFDDNYETSNVSTVTVEASSDPAPVATNDTATTNGTTPVVIGVLDNDSDTNMDETSVVIVANGTHGSAIVVDAATDTISYTADDNFSGTDTFTYLVSDVTPQQSNIATVTITVNALNTPSSSATFTAGDIEPTGNGIITLDDIGTNDTGTYPEEDIAQSCIGGCFDFELSGIANGATASVVLPLSTGIPEKSKTTNAIRYRKFRNESWHDFESNGGLDTVKSAAGTVNGSDIICPPETDSDYSSMETGHRCLLLTITDGGPNDDDGTANGTVVDPGGLAEVTVVTGTDGCSMTGNNGQAKDHADWLLLAGFMAVLGWFGFKRRKA